MAFSKKRTYLDWAAAAPTSALAHRAFENATQLAGNPSSPHAEGRAAKGALEDARLRIARLAGTKQDAVIFTSGATEANALGIRGYVGALVEKGKNIHVLYMPSAHASVLGAIGALRVETEALSLKDGAIDLSRLKEQVRPETMLVIVDVVCGETGALYKVRDVRRALDTARKNGPRIMLFADASQAPRTESFEPAHLGADMLSLDAQKVGGVRGIGALIAPRYVALNPLLQGGGQERGLRPGTESPALATAFAAALEECAQNRSSFAEKAARKRQSLLEAIATIPGLEVNGGKENVPNILNVSLHGRDTDYLAALLDEAGFAVSTKSACETDEKGSRAVLAMTGDEARATSTLRISWGPTTTQNDLTRFADALLSSVRFMDGNTIQ
ncbi:MAG: aminotransferase class V-fold PLP-dependent enzyme [Patescibacteria group bacterium]